MDAPILPYEWDLSRMKNERLQNKNIKRVITQHEMVSKRCVERSESAAICIIKTNEEIAMAKEVP